MLSDLLTYKECNERVLGSKWLGLSDYSDCDEIVEELNKEGFEVDSMLRSKNVSIQMVSKDMGHSDSSISLQVYSHFISGGFCVEQHLEIMTTSRFI